MIRRISIKSWKFLLAGKGLSFRTGQYFGEAVLVGLFAGFVVVAFRFLIDLGESLLMGGAWLEGRRWAMVFLPALGALAGHFLIKRFARLEHARGTDSAIRAYHQNDGYITSAVIPIKSVASILTVGSGGSAGYEGPVTLIGAACGSAVARSLNLTVRARRILMAAGLSAGIAALFQAPLAGAIFGFEIFYSSSDVEYETVLPCFIAAPISYTIYAYFYGWQPLFAMPDCSYENALRLLPYFALALVITFGARFYISFFRGTEERFANWRVPGFAKVVAGGLVVGLVGYFVFPGVYGAGYPIIRRCLAESGDAQTFLAIFVLNVVATSFTVGSGGSGGVFAPALVCGATLGAATGLVFARILPASWGIHPSAFALVGMAGARDESLSIWAKSLTKHA
jgi:CIC family chloride channel protein